MFAIVTSSIPGRALGGEPLLISSRVAPTFLASSLKIPLFSLNGSALLGNKTDKLIPHFFSDDFILSSRFSIVTFL